MAKISIPTSIAGISIPGSAISGPLSKLYGPPQDTSVSQYIYPRNLGTDSERQHVIVFDIKEAGTSNIDAASEIGSALNTVQEIGANAATAFTSGNYTQAVTGIGNEVLDTAKSSLKYVTDNLAYKEENLNTITQIALYVPDTVNVQYNPSYNDVSLTSALGTPFFLAQTAVSAADKLKSAIQGGIDKSTAGKLTNAAANDPFIRQFLTQVAGDTIGGSGADLAQIIQNKAQTALNPQMQVLFQGIGFRSFQFDFVLTPYSKQEADSIKNIVKALKKAALPSFQDNALNSKMFFNVPNKFDISFYYKGQENRNVHRIGRSVLENITVDYAPMGWTTFEDGNPVQTRLTLQFKEIKLITKKEIDEGY